MRILIAGAGKVGRALTDELSSEGHDITLVDMDSRVLEDAVGMYDVITLQGNSASKAVLEEAGMIVEPIRVIALYDHNLRNRTHFPSNICSAYPAIVPNRCSTSSSLSLSPNTIERSLVSLMFIAKRVDEKSVTITFCFSGS